MLPPAYAADADADYAFDAADADADVLLPLITPCLAFR